MGGGYGSKEETERKGRMDKDERELGEEMKREDGEGKGRRAK